jgi:hypothetical protein
VAKLGVTADDLKRLRSGVGGAPRVGGGCLIDPLQPGEQSLASALQEWSSKARVHPVAQ